MKRNVLTLALFGLVPLLTHASDEQRWPEAPAGWALTVRFTSPGNGIDDDTYDHLRQVAADEVREGRLSAFTSRPWGREGEIDLCLQFQSAERKDLISDKLQKLIAAGNKRERFDKTSLLKSPSCPNP